MSAYTRRFVLVAYCVGVAMNVWGCNPSNPPSRSGPVYRKFVTATVVGYLYQLKSLLLMLHRELRNLRAVGLIHNNAMVVILCQNVSPPPRPHFGALLDVRFCQPLPTTGCC